MYLAAMNHRRLRRDLRCLTPTPLSSSPYNIYLVYFSTASWRLGSLPTTRRERDYPVHELFQHDNVMSQLGDGVRWII